MYSMSALREMLVLHLLFTLFGIIGVLARVGLTRLTEFEGQAYGGVLWANFAGSFIMGLLSQNKVLFGNVLDDQVTKRKHPYKTLAEVPLYTGLATGLCGSITSFSSFQLQLFTVASIDAWRYPNAGYGVMAWLSYAIITLSVSIGGFLTGKHATKAMGEEWCFPLAKYESILEICLSGLGLAGWVVALVLAIVKPTATGEWHYWCLCCVFGPFGVFLRHFCSVTLNPCFKSFKLGTFSANMVGTIIIAVLVLLQRGATAQGKILSSPLQCHVLGALQDGFCGNLTTISSFVAELVFSSKSRHAYFYGTVSVLAGFAIMVLILGSYQWTHGLVSTCAQ